MFGTYCTWFEGGLTAFPWVPLPCLTALQELCTLWPYGPNPDTCSIDGFPVYHPVHWSAYFDSPYMGIQHLFFDNGGAASGGLAQASPTSVGVWADRSVPVCLSSPMTPVPWAAGGTGRVTTLLCPSQGGHQPHYLVLQLFWARGHLCSGSWPHLDLSFLCFTFSSPCSDHQLGIGGLRVTI